MAIQIGAKGSSSLNLTQQIKKGEPGGTYYPEVSEEGILTWVPSEEGMPEIEPANIRGVQGIQGVPGKDGLNLIHIGTEEPVDNEVLVWLYTEPDTVQSGDGVKY